jgi:hypothetical protein
MATRKARSSAMSWGTGISIQSRVSCTAKTAAIY